MRAFPSASYSTPEKGAWDRPNGSGNSQRGTALIVVLCFVVLLTIVVVAFLSQSSVSRQIFNARAGQTQVDILSDSAIQFMQADFRQEIVSGSLSGSTYTGTNSSGTPVPTYIPATSAAVVPSRTGFTPGATATADPYANIVKVSRAQTNFFSGSYFNTAFPSPNYASPVSTATPSLNGRYVDNAATGWTTNGWDKPQLIDTTTYPTALASAPLPDWIYVTTSGRKSPAITVPESDVVGRYAYVVYDEGGLLDINSAGYNTALSTADAYDVARKGSLGLADLTQIPGINATIRDALVSWRNHATSSGTYTSNPNAYPPTNAPSTATPFLQYLVDGNLNGGFLKTYPGDQKFLSRQDLLAYQATGTSGLPTQSLAYLGTFSRTLNAPTWTPIDSPGETFTPATTYAANAEFLDWPSSLVATTEPVYNRDVPNVRWAKDITIIRPKLDDDTGTQTEAVTFHKGDPVLQHRFPLSKLALLSNPAAKTSSATTPGTVAWAVLYYFGLQWSSTGNATFTTAQPYNPGAFEPHWEYVHCRAFETGDSTIDSKMGQICSIGEVASTTVRTGDPYFFKAGSGDVREPDFFELLMAGILRGSISRLNLFDIGICAIDQTTSTDVPSLLTLPVAGTPPFWVGRKSLPYFCQMLFWPYRPKADPTRIEAYVVPMIWNPHRNANVASTTVTKFRMYHSYSASSSSVWGRFNNGPLPSTPAGNDLDPSNNGVPYMATSPGYTYDSTMDPDVTPSTASNSNKVITFNASTDFSEPTILSSKYLPAPVVAPTDPNTGNPAEGLTETPNSKWGFFLGSKIIPDPTLFTRLGLVLPPVPWTLPGSPANPTTYPVTTNMGLVGSISQAGVGWRLQCQDSSGAWHTYADVILGSVGASNHLSATTTAGAKIGITGAAYTAAPSFSSASGADAYDYVGGLSFGPLDPRINFMGIKGVGSNTPSRAGNGTVWIASVGGTSITAPPIGASLRPAANTTATQMSQFESAGGADANDFGTPTNILAADYSPLWSENDTTIPAPNSTYSDDGGLGIVGTRNIAVTPNVVAPLEGDGVFRPGDGVNKAYPMAADPLSTDPSRTGHFQDRPLILNRPFLSVGELGYTFRSLEWKTLDFSTVTSGDSGLLDLFSINDTENANQQSMISGVVNLNSHNPSVLQALISGGLINGLDSTGAGITSANAQTMASAIVAETNGQGTGLKAGPLLNRAQLATRVVPLPDIAAALSAGSYVSKDRREAVVRALAEPSDTRTWNLLIDLVVQAGRYPTSAVTSGSAAAMSQFDVQGERRYWLHLSIDRYTGKVIDEQLEVVRDN